MNNKKYIIITLCFLSLVIITTFILVLITEALKLPSLINIPIGFIIGHLYAKLEKSYINKMNKEK